MTDLRERRRQQVHQEVRAAAIGLMSTRGFDGVTVEEIAACTSVSASTIYRHFGTKEALVLTLGRPEQVVERVASDSKRDAVSAIRRAVNKVYGKDDAVPDELQLVVGNDGLREEFRRELADSAPSLADALAARRDETTASLADAALAAAALAAATVGLLEWSREPGTKLTKVLDEVLTVLSAGD